MNSFKVQRSKALQQQIAQLREAEPGLTFTAAWKRLRQKRPDLFADYTRPSTPAPYQPSPKLARAEKISRAQLVIRAALTELQAEEGLSFTEAWNMLKEERPELFACLSQAAVPSSAILIRAADYSWERVD
jgi:hypothetical protein